MDKEDVLKFISDMMDALNFRRVLLLTLFVSVLLTLLITFENRTILFNRLFEKQPVEAITIPWELSDKSKQQLTNLVNSQERIGGVIATEIDLKKNRRVIKFWFTKDDSLREKINAIVLRLLPQPFFDDDRKNNDQMLSVLSNQFKCTPTADTIFMRFFPEMATRYPYICRLSVPPFSGEFAGMLTIFLDKSPTKADIEALKIELSRISIELYLLDVDKGHKR
jgi:hypothetical protein